MKNINKTFALFLICHFILWSVIPCFRSILPLDTLEAIFWGTIQNWGTNKHPPLSGLLAYTSWIIGGKSDLSLYILNQVCLLIAFLFIFKIGKMYLSPKKALMAILLMEGIVYYGFQSVEFNVNVVSLALWPLTTYFFLKSIQKNQWYDWVLTGLFAGLNILNKYVCVILFLCMILYLLTTKSGREKMKGYGPYLALTIAFFTILPHLIWLIETNFVVVNYFLGRGSSVAYHPLNHLIYPVRFLITQMGFFIPVFLGYLFCSKNKEESETSKEKSQQLFFMGILPLILTTSVSAILGVKLKTMWGYPLLYLSSICLFYFWPRKINEHQERKCIKCTYVFLILMSFAYLGQIAFNQNRNFQTIPQELTAEIAQKWQEVNPDSPLTLVGGHTWWASMMFVYHPETQKILYQMDPKACRWFDMNQIKHKGMMVFSEDEEEFKDWQKEYPTLSGPYSYEHLTHNWFKKTGKKKMFYGFIKE